jgi:hypothetical protein
LDGDGRIRVLYTTRLKREVPVARRPNYGFERAERARAKAAKKEAKKEAKAAAKAEKAGDAAEGVELEPTSVSESQDQSGRDV